MIAYALATFASIPLVVLFYDGLGGLSVLPRVLVTACCVGILLSAIVVTLAHVKQLRKPGRYSVVAAAGAAIGATYISGDFALSVGGVSLIYSDGSRWDNASPAWIQCYGRTVQGHVLHPPFDSTRVAESLLAKFPAMPSTVKVWIAKPEHALLSPDGTPTPSDGITLEIRALDESGRIEAVKVANVSQAEFMGRRWIAKRITAPTGIAELSVTVTKGPEGSTTFYDSTIVALQARGPRADLFAIGNALLAGLAVAMTAVAGIGWLQSHRSGVAFGGSYKLKEIGHYTLGLAMFAAVVLAVVYWSESQTSFVYYWDFRNYWSRTEYLYERMASGSWSEAAHDIVRSVWTDYSMLPAVAPALLSLIVGYPGRLVYSLAVALLYVVPAFLMVGYLAQRLLGDEPVRGSRRGYWLAVSALAPLFGLPVYLGVALSQMPDIGGVVVFVGGILLVWRLAEVVAMSGAGVRVWPPDGAVVRTSLAVGLVLCAMFLFRRWYVFAAAGAGVGGALLIGYDIWRRRDERQLILGRAVIAAVVVGATVLSLLAWVMFEWARDLEGHRYSSLYSSYARPLDAVAKSFVSTFGVGVLSVALSFYVMGRSLRLDGRLLFVVVTASIVSAALFLQVQGPSVQHYYLLMPLLGAGLAGIARALTARGGAIGGLAFGSGLALLGVMVTESAGAGGWFRVIVPGFESWLPKQQAGAAELKRMGEWLLSPDNRARRFCVLASSVRVNQSLVSELWQIDPAVHKRALADRMVVLGDVDSRDGAPWVSLRQCELVLVGWPPQTHLPPGEQYSVVLPAVDLVGRAGIGVAFEKLPETFVMEEVRILVFRRIRELTEEEYQGLVERFHRLRSGSAGRQE